MCSIPSMPVHGSSFYVLPHSLGSTHLLSRSVRTANSDLSFADNWTAADSNLYNTTSNVSSLMPIESQEIQSSVYYEDNPSAANLDDNRSVALEANGANSYEISNNYPSSLVVGSNIGSALISSMATLTNASEPMPEMGSSTIYGHEMNDLIYANNASHQMSSQNSSEYLLTDLISEEDLHLMSAEMSAAANQTLPHYHMSSHHSGQAQSHTLVNTTEDVMDASSDSAVSSMSSERIQSFSDNEWVDSCSETSSHNGDPNHNDYRSRMPSHIYRMANSNSAQKKYKLFGRRTESKEQAYNGRSVDPIQSNNTSTYSDGYASGLTDYCYPDLSNQTQQNHNLMANSLPSVSSVAHNHSYHMPSHSSDLSAMSPLSVTGNHHWMSTDNESGGRMRRYSSDDSENLTEAQQQSRDEKRAKALKIPIATFDIINLPIDEFNERLAKYELNEAQLSLIRDIRRRGKNKVAAQNCRKRKLDQILGLQHEVDGMFSQKHSLKSEYDELMVVREMARDKYTKLYHFILEASQHNLYDSALCPPEYPHRSEGSHNSIIVNNNCSDSELRISSLSEMQMNFQNEKFEKKD